jgi:anti-sigma B factor antagonist
MKIRVRIIQNVNILNVEGTIDINSIQIIEVVGEFLKYKKSNILINCKKVDKIDYQGLTILVIAYKNVINNNGKMKFCNVSRSLLGLFKVAHLDVVFDIYDNEKAAVKSFTEFVSPIEKKQLRRRFKRLDMHVHVTYGSAAHPKKTHEGTLLNISGAGIYLRCKHTFPVKTRLQLTIKLTGEPRTVKTLGIVIWNADREVQPHAYPGMGVTFVGLKPAVQKKILGFIDKNISHRSGSGLYTE